MNIKVILIDEKKKSFEKLNNQTPKNRTKTKTKCHFPAPLISNLPSGNNLAYLAPLHVL